MMPVRIGEGRTGQAVPSLLRPARAWRRMRRRAIHDEEDHYSGADRRGRLLRLSADEPADDGRGPAARIRDRYAVSINKFDECAGRSGAIGMDTTSTSIRPSRRSKSSGLSWPRSGRLTEERADSQGRRARGQDRAVFKKNSIIGSDARSFVGPPGRRLVRRTPAPASKPSSKGPRGATVKGTVSGPPGRIEV